MKDEIKVGLTCNNNCVFCLNERRDLDRTTDELISEIDRLALLGYDEVQFTGGEVTIRKDFFDILRYSKSKGLKIGIQSNGRTFSYKQFSDMVAEVGIRLYLISLHAHNEELNSIITQTKGAYKQTVNGIKNILSKKQSVIINTVITAHNVKYLPQIAEHHSQFNVATLQFSWCRPEGKVQGKNAKLIPKYSENIQYLIEAIKKTEGKHFRVSIHGVPLCMLGELIKYNADPYKDLYLATADMKSGNAWVNEKKKTFAPQCADCSVTKKCGGIFKGYVEEYGFDEFKPINKI